jgi:hypothetical protein
MMPSDGIQREGLTLQQALATSQQQSENDADVALSHDGDDFIKGSDNDSDDTSIFDDANELTEYARQRQVISATAAFG